ncbi:hypothetical protein [Sulfitobacter sp.]|uniref:hypothetical protein n=1 Tax=Sulfitobacter sp. TaxID=1903071 RepID=UPI003001F037
MEYSNELNATIRIAYTIPRILPTRTCAVSVWRGVSLMTVLRDKDETAPAVLARLAGDTHRLKRGDFVI